MHTCVQFPICIRLHTTTTTTLNYTDKLKTPATAATTTTTTADTSRADCMGVCLGMLINVLEQDANLCDALRGTQPQHHTSSTVQLLCKLRDAVAADAGRLGPSGDGEATPLSQGAELTLDSFASLESQGQASFLLVYLCIVLGFLAVSSAAAAAEVTAGLPAGGSFDVLVGPIEQCLEFYASMGVMSKESQDNLRLLVGKLKAA